MSKFYFKVSPEVVTKYSTYDLICDVLYYCARKL